jgi:GR25 family glycosyltransferase involved in LPS biosynthesis
MNTKTQNSVLLKTLQRRNLTVYQIMNDLGIGCPTKRISELNGYGQDIETRKTKVKTRWGRSVIATYVLR